MENNGNKITMHERMAVVETKLDSILVNHLPHLEKKVDALAGKFWSVIVLLIVALVGIVATYFK